MNKLAILDPKEFGLDEIKANEITSGLTQIRAERDILVEQYQQVILLDINETATAKKAAELRKAIKSNRTSGFTAWHKANKEFFLRGGQFVDAIKNKEIAENERMEEQLEKIEKHAELMRIEAIKKLNVERLNELLPYEYIENTNINLGEMPNELWENFLAGVKLNWQEKKRIEAETAARLEAERIAEEKRQAELKAEQERIAAENARLKAEAEAKEKALAEERAKVEAEKRAAEEAARKEREALEAKLKKEQEERDAIIAAEQAKLKAEADAKLKAEQEAKAKLEAELKAKRDAELKAEQEKEALLAAPDKDKLIAFGKMLKELELPKCTSKKYIAVVNQLQKDLENTIDNLRNLLK